jgi:threonine aldolase
VMPRALRTSDGRLTPDLLRAAAKPHAFNRAEIGLVVLENTHTLAGGTVTGVGEMRVAIAVCGELGFHVHVDGARLWNAAVALGVAPAELVRGADTVMVALSKGLSCPVGSLLLGSAELMGKAFRVRQQLGGGMRQAGILAAAGLVALDTMIPRLAEDHANALVLGAALGRCPGVSVAPSATNIVVGQLQTRGAPEVAAALKARGVLASAMDRTTLRLVTHRGVSRADCERAAAILGEVVA